MEYRKYLRGIGIIKKNSCKKTTCSSLKVKESNQEKYGVDNVMQLSENKDKAKKTNLERFGTENPNQLDSIKNQIKSTNLKKYGVEHPMMLDVVKDKIKNTNVVGGSSKLLEYFIKKYEPNRIISYADRDWSIGTLYETLGFEKVYESKPDYKYIINGKRVHKSNFKKSIIGISESKLEIPKVYDCGKIKYSKKI